MGAATGRFDAAAALIDDFTAAADKTGAENDAAHFQASVVQLTEDTLRIYGADNFPASVLSDVGVDRPAAQRFTDKPYVEVGVSDTDLGNSPDFSNADGDIVYVSFSSPEAKDRAPAVLEQRRVAKTVGRKGQPGLRRQQRSVADRRRESSRRAAYWRTCAGSTLRSTSPTRAFHVLTGHLRVTFDNAFRAPGLGG